MKSVVRKLFVNFEKEEKWLNEMSAKGLNFIDYTFGRYLFEEGVPNEYIYRLELLNELPTHPESKAYIKFMEDSGVECMSTYMRWVYFRKKATEGAFDLYSDYDSRIKHYQKVIKLIGFVDVLNLVAALLNLIIGIETGINEGIYFNLYFSLPSWAIVVVFTLMLISYLKKVKKMKKDKFLYE